MAKNAPTWKPASHANVRAVDDVPRSRRTSRPRNTKANAATPARYRELGGDRQVAVAGLGQNLRPLMNIRHVQGIREPVPEREAESGHAQHSGAHPSMRVPHSLDCRLGPDKAIGPKVAGRRTVEPEDVRTVGVVGCGLMGSGIVEVLARTGIDVLFLEPTDDLVAAGLARIESSTGRAVERSKLAADDRDAILGRARGVIDPASFKDVELVIEAATEDPAVKLETFARLDAVVGSDVVLASNTSSIPIATLGAVTGRPEQVIGMHFFNPPPVMGLVELTPSLSTSEETVAFARGFGERLGKTVVVAKDQAGFIVNRLVIPYLCAAIRLYDEGFATREDIDTAMTLGMNHPMGPLALADFIGLDTVLQIAQVLHAEFREPRYAPPPRLQRMVDAGHLGKKSGHGFYDY